jgi:hypothetical protein
MTIADQKLGQHDMKLLVHGTVSGSGVMGEEVNGLELGDRLDQILVDRDEIRLVLIVDDHVRETDEKACFFIDRVGHAIPHRRNQEVSHVGAIDRPYADANLLTLGHGSLLPPPRLSLAFSAKEFLTLAQLLIFMLAHFLSALFQHA